MSYRKRGSKLILTESDYRKLIANLAMKSLGYNRTKRRKLLREANGQVFNINIKLTERGKKKAESLGIKSFSEILDNTTNKTSYGVSFKSNETDAVNDVFQQLMSWKITENQNFVLDQGVKYVIQAHNLLASLLTFPVTIDKLFAAGALLNTFIEKDVTPTKMYTRLLFSIYANKNISKGELFYDFAADPLVLLSMPVKFTASAFKVAKGLRQGTTSARQIFKGSTNYIDF